MNGTTPRLRVLVLDEEPPYPCNSGKKIRTWSLLHGLAQRHSVTYVCYAPSASPAIAAFREVSMRLVTVAPRRFESGAWRYARVFANLFSEQPYVVAKHDSVVFDRAVRALLRDERFDLVQCEWTPYARVALRARATGSGDATPILIAAHNIETDILRRRAVYEINALRRGYFQLQAAKMERFERAAFAGADFVVTVSERDRNRTIAWGAKRTGVVPNGSDTEHIRPTPSRAFNRTELLFIGALDWFANIDAISWFLADIFPLIRAADSSVHLSVVGSRPCDRVRRLVHGVAGVTFFGQVDDVRPFYDRCDVVVAPLRIAGGTRIKILEAMAAGKPVVSTTVGAEGLDVVHGVHLLMADDPETFARSVLRTLKTDVFAEMSLRARALVEKHSRWELHSLELERCWLSLMT
jgi:polysaccharide biosynthesis protein PslH